MSGPQRNPDTVNTIGVVVIGICGAVLVYVSIGALQAFYMNDTTEVDMLADYGGQDITARTIRSEQVNAINTAGPNQGRPTFRIPIDHAMKLVVESAKTDAGNLVPTQGRSNVKTIEPMFGRPRMAMPATAPAGADASGSGSGSGSVVVPAAAPMTPTGGAGPGGGPAPGAGPTPTGGTAPGSGMPTGPGGGSAGKGNGP